MVILNTIKANPLLGLTLFFVETYHKSLVWMKKLGLEIYPNIYLGVGFQSLYFIGPSRKEIFRVFDFKTIKSVKSYPLAIVFSFDNFKDEVRFNTSESLAVRRSG